MTDTTMTTTPPAVGEVRLYTATGATYGRLTYRLQVVAPNVDAAQDLIDQWSRRAASVIDPAHVAWTIRAVRTRSADLLLLGAI